MSYDDTYSLTPEELYLYNKITQVKHEKIRGKALRCLHTKLTEEEKKYCELIYKLKYDFAFRDIVITLLIVNTK